MRSAEPARLTGGTHRIAPYVFSAVALPGLLAPLEVPVSVTSVRPVATSRAYSASDEGALIDQLLAKARRSLDQVVQASPIIPADVVLPLPARNRSRHIGRVLVRNAALPFAGSEIDVEFSG